MIQENTYVPKFTKINPSTKLLEYDSFVDHLNKRFALEPQKVLTSLLFIEFDNLVWFNDIFDLNIDDDIMQQLVEKLKLLLGAKDLLVRINNNQYVIMHDLYELEKPMVLAKEVIHILHEPFAIDSNMFYVNGSIGVSQSPIDGYSAQKLLSIAERMMRYAQKEGKNNIRCTKGITEVLSCEKSQYVIEDLPAALENGEIYFLYQLQYSHKEKRFTGAEILVRWLHPKYGAVSPDFFIPLVEKSGMIGPLTIRAIIAASEVFTLLKKNGIEDFSLSVNISPTHLLSSDFYETISFLIEHYPLRGEKLKFEITEEVLMQHTDTLIEKLEKLKDLGIMIELDDFGTGYTSLQHLAYLPIDTLKVDKSFVQDIDKDLKKKALFTAIADMAKALDINVIAEGVENNLEDEIIKGFESITVQGYLYAKPIPLDTLIEKISK